MNLVQHLKVAVEIKGANYNKHVVDSEVTGNNSEHLKSPERVIQVHYLHSCRIKDENRQNEVCGLYDADV